MKKVSIYSFLISTLLIFSSCGTTENVSQATQEPKKPQTAEEVISNTQQDAADNIAEEINAAFPDSQKPETEIETQANPLENETQAETPLEIKNENTEEEKNSAIIPEELSESKDEPSLSENQIPSLAGDDEKSNSNESEKSELLNSEISDETENTEKVSEEDSNLTKEREEAPTTDERGKVSEYQIFEEPEIIVLDLPEEPAEEIKSPETEETVQPVESIEPTEITVEPTIAENHEATDTEVKNSRITNEVRTPNANDSIVKSEESAPALESNENTDDITPSRSVAVKINQYLDVTYPGKGWSYIGETEKDNLFNYFGRKLGSTNTTFSLRAKKAGNTKSLL